MKLTETKDGTIIDIYVKPNSQKFGITLEEGEIIVRCTEEPEKGRVNKELVKEFTKLFHSQIELVSGATSKQKRFLVRGKNPSLVEQALKMK